MRGVTKSYDGKSLVVRHLDLDVARGEFLTLLGPSGSGKTTTLMMLAGFEAATTGEILLEGRSVTRLPPHKRGIGMVFQNYALFPHMTVAQNLAYPLTVRKVPRAEIGAKVRRALDMVRLAGFDDRRPAQLSGGQQQRVALARALVFEPSLVLMDEPLGALDKQLRERMQFEIRTLHEQLGTTFVYVTHDQGEALAMSDRIAVFHEGVVQQLDTAEGLYERPQNGFVAGFIGESNRLAGTVRTIGRGEARVSLDAGGEITGRVADAEAAGTRALVSLRPERARILRPDDRADNMLSGRVRELIYLGDHTRVVLSVAGSDDFVVKAANTGSVLPHGTGETVTVGFGVQDCVALKAAAN
ncbi:ABC transporter ATP-binding protein [Reyranella sp. CPCC 100927]|uniref:ABC transporter ATP-binding protein n=1 Tax=Reyranella sp. CPCC 100927 TaxID=2599616 RepID=UPI0011B48D21|nr:ABC transporter ATP-binding protein [Reyranella sp. CPCC 100927]TWS96637.1 ABC transporter ATP-binding protein [Reyranella sp. CPCC 100927]